MGRKLAIGLVIVVVIGAGLVLSGGKLHLRLGEHHVGLKHGKHSGHHRRGGMERTINVSGTGTVVVLPDRVAVMVGVVSFGKDAATALDINNGKMERVVEGLLSLGLERNDIQTSQFELDKQTDRKKIAPDNPEGLVGYTVRNMVRVQTARVDLVSMILEKVIGWGATNIGGLNFSISNQADLMTEARNLAIEDARATAEEIATASGVDLGKVLLVNERNGRYRETSVAKEVQRLDADMPIYMTQERVTAGVAVTFAIK